MKDYSLLKESEPKENIDIFGSCYSILYDEFNKRLLLLNRLNERVDIVRLENGEMKLDDPKDLSDYSAVTIALSKSNEIYIGCESSKAIIVFDDKFTFLRKFGDINIRDFEEMVLNDDASEVYLAAQECKKVSRYNTTRGELIHELHFTDEPWHIAFKNKMLYVYCANSRCIQVYDSENNTLINKISVDVNWKYLEALYIDNNSNIFVCGNYGQSMTTYLFIFDKSYNLVNKIPVGEFYHVKKGTTYFHISEMTVVDDNLFILKSFSVVSDADFLLQRFHLK